MKNIVTIGIALMYLAPLVATGTPQIADQLDVGGTYYQIPWDSPFQTQWDQLSDRVLSNRFSSCTACWRGYFAEWSISNRCLFLRSVSVPEIGPQGFGRELPLTSFDQSWTNSVKATWFTGEIACPILAIGPWRDPYGGMPLLFKVFHIKQGHLESTGYRPLGWRTLRPYILIVVIGLVVLIVLRNVRKKKQAQPTSAGDVATRAAPEK